MYPYINLGFAHIGTFGLLLWFGAVCATWVLHRNFLRGGVDADALNVVVFTVVAGILGAKLWHELQNIPELILGWRQIMLPGWHHPTEILLGFFAWFKAGFAWFGGLTAGIITLVAQGMALRLNGLRGVKSALRMLDLSAPAAAVGYGIGRIGCLTSGDGDYGINTTLPWGVHMANGRDFYHRALVPPDPPNALVQPTPLYELLYSLAIAWWLWRRGSKPVPLGVLTGQYLVLSGIGRFLVEFVRVNPRLYWHHTMSNAQLAALGSVAAGIAMILIMRKNQAVIAEPIPAHTGQHKVATA